MNTLTSLQTDSTTGDGIRIDVLGVGITRGDHTILRDVTLSIEPGELVAVVGASGAGKSTLLDAIAGVRPPTTGAVCFDGVTADRGDRTLRHLVGYVPQDDIIHRDLPVAATLRYAAQLRLPAGTSPGVIDHVVAETLARLDLADRASVRVGDLSGGQRKRTSIAVELLTRPRVFFLDEPTSGLDPATAANLMGTLRHLANQGTTVVLTTHSTDDLRASDRMVVLNQGGVGFVGSPAEALRHFRVEHLADIYVRSSTDVPVAPTSPAAAKAPSAAAVESRPPNGSAADRSRAVAQWAVLVRRSLDILRRNRLTLAIMLGAPALVIAMFAMLFRPDALDPSNPDATAAVSTTYWMAFAAFFFGLTYGLLQISTELAIVRRERFVGLRIGPYLAAKVTVLAPVLMAVNVTMLAVLRALDRLPALGVATYGRILVTLEVTSLAALALGLLASAAVSDPVQATLALPMLCFPAVLFAGGVLPVPTMEIVGRAISAFVVARWSFEALGRDLDLTSLLAGERTGAGPALLRQYGDTFDHHSNGSWVILIAFTAACLIATAAVLRRRTTSTST